MQLRVNNVKDRDGKRNGRTHWKGAAVKETEPETKRQRKRQNHHTQRQIQEQYSFSTIFLYLSLLLPTFSRESSHFFTHSPSTQYAAGNGLTWAHKALDNHEEETEPCQGRTTSGQVKCTHALLSPKSTGLSMYLGVT